MAKKIVMYKGEDTKTLKRGKMYTVKKEERVGWNTKYRLEEVPGDFDMTLFGKKEFLAFSDELPKRGKDIKINIVSGNKIIETTVTPHKVVNMGVTLFKIETDNTTFCVKVNVE